MDATTRSYLARQVDVQTRRKLGLPAATTHVIRREGAKSRRWAKDEIRVAVRKVAGGKTKISPGEYIAKRKHLDPELYPSYPTVHRRCPELFT